MRPLVLVVVGLAAGLSCSAAIGPLTRARLEVADVAADKKAPPVSLEVAPGKSVSERFAELRLSLRCTGASRGKSWALSGELTDQSGQDRAVDFTIRFPADLAGWHWWHDINRWEELSVEREFEEQQYPLIVLTPPNDQLGFALAVEPSQPFIYRLTAGPGGVALHAPFGLTPEGVGPVKSRAAFACYLFPVDGRWGFRDALRRYYALFPRAFERLSRAEGMWLFAFPNNKLPNPAHYAYHEGGPGGWEYDEEHGILTMPYTEVSSSTINLPRLPQGRADALEAWNEYRRTRRTSLAAWTLRAAAADPTVSRAEGARSLKCHKTVAGEWVGASQDIPVHQKQIGAIKISGWSKAQNVTGVRDREYSLYGDIQLENGEWFFGQIASFEPGTHDWQYAEHVFTPPRPAALVRLHCLFRAGHTGTVWFDDISVTTAAEPDKNLAANPGFEQDAVNAQVAALEAYALEAADGGPVFRIATDFSSDVKPKVPYKLLRFTCNPSPYLDDLAPERLPPGKLALEKYQQMFENIPQIDGAYIDSVSAWATGCLNYRHAHFHCSRNPFSYDAETKRVVAPGRYYTYDFLEVLGEKLHPQRRYVFTNIHNTMNTFLLYTVSDVPGIESSISNHERFAYIRSASYQKPAVLLNFLNLGGFGKRAKQDEHWRRSVLYALYPSVGRRCDEAYAKFKDLYQTFMPGLKTLSAAGWEPVTHARCNPAGPHVERYGSWAAGDLYFAVLNDTGGPYRGRLRLDTAELGLQGAASGRAADIIRGRVAPLVRQGDGAYFEVSLPPGEVAAYHVAAAGQQAQEAAAELKRVGEHVRRALEDSKAAQAAAPLQLLAKVEKLAQDSKQRLDQSLVQAIVAEYNRQPALATTWTGETIGESLLRALRLALRANGGAYPARAALEGPDAAVAGDRVEVRLRTEPQGEARVFYLVHDAGGLRLLRGGEFAAPAEGFGGVFEVIALADSASARAAIVRPIPLRPAVQATLSFEAPLALSRTKKARLHLVNNSSTDRSVAVVCRPPGEGWSVSLGEVEVKLPAGTARDLDLAVEAPKAGGFVQELSARIASGTWSTEAQARAVFVAPERLQVNLARAEGVEATVDSCYHGYVPAAVNDGEVWPRGAHWTKFAWASAESGDPHWIEFHFARPTKVSRVIVYWEATLVEPHAGREVLVEVRRDGQWQRVASARNTPHTVVSELRFDAVTTSRLRVVQPAGAGSEARPNLMWVSEVEIGA